MNRRNQTDPRTAGIARQFRFSLRALLVLTALIAAGCYWWIARPTIVASRFVCAVQGEDFAAANREFTDSRHAMLAQQRAGVEYPIAYPPGTEHTMLYRDEPYDVQWKAKIHPRTWRDVFEGRRRISLSGSYFIITTRTTSVEKYEIVATPMRLTVARRITVGYGR